MNTISQKNVINKTIEYVKKTLSGDATGHDWYHIERVWKTAKYIAGKEKNVDLFVIELAALLHDIADWKFNKGDELAGARISQKWLEENNVNKKTIDQVCNIIATSSFKGAGVRLEMKTLEGKIVQDADRLDALGAIGIARVFAYGGSNNREIYNPKIHFQYHKSANQYKNNSSPSINHFYEKLLLLKDMMNTKTGKKLAQKRHKFMELYLKEFFNEWNGN